MFQQEKDNEKRYLESQSQKPENICRIWYRISRTDVWEVGIMLNGFLRKQYKLSNKQLGSVIASGRWLSLWGNFNLFMFIVIFVHVFPVWFLFSPVITIWFTCIDHSVMHNIISNFNFYLCMYFLHRFMLYLCWMFKTFYQGLVDISLPMIILCTKKLFFSSSSLKLVNSHWEWDEKKKNMAWEELD